MEEDGMKLLLIMWTEVSIYILDWLTWIKLKPGFELCWN